jgi:glycosyltransferase involved in cell wall biosynthesis
MRGTSLNSINVGTARADGKARKRTSSQDEVTVSVVIPTLNEAENLAFVINTIPDWVNEIIVVDGCSADDTVRIAQVLRPDIKVILEPTRGKGAAIRAGAEAATGDILILMDGDGSMDGAEICAFRDALLAGADYAKGSRFVTQGGSADITRLRRFGDWGICLIIRALFGAKYTDGTYGFKGIWKDCLEYVRIDTDGFEVELLIDIRAHRAGLRTVGIPCFETHRIHGVSNLSAPRDGLRCMQIILRERLRRYRAPIER